MAEYIGARISLISKSDIRYVGTLVEINSENSTVALENVRSMGTEDRRQGAGAQQANDRLYEYIVFRGSDVKDLRIEEAPKPAEQKQEMPDDPAILGSTRPPNQTGTPSQQPPFGQPPPYAQGFPPYPPPGQGFGRGGPGFPPPGPGGPGSFGYPGPYGPPPPGWYPPPGQGFPGGPPGGPPGPFSPQPPGAPQQQGGPPRKQPTPIGPGKDSKAPPAEQKKAELPAKAESSTAPAPPQAAAKGGLTQPVDPNPDVAATKQAKAQPVLTQAPPTGPKQNRAPIPRQAPAVAATAQKAPDASFASATQAATAAVAAAMAKLPMAQKVGSQAPPTGEGSVDNLTKKVQEMRTDDHNRQGRAPGTNAYRGRGRGRGGHHQQSRPVEVPTTDFDFESSNAKFNKDEFAHEAVTSPGAEEVAATNGHEAKESKEEEVVIPKAENAYDKKSSFFDNISSELKDKQAAQQGLRGGEFRHEERKKNMETFGQGSVDGGYRRGYGRGRGRGFRGGPRGGFQNRGGYQTQGRGGAGTAPTQSS